MKIALAMLVIMSLCSRVAAGWPACSKVPECKKVDGKLDGKKPCCDPDTKIVWDTDGCKAELYAVLSGDPETTGPFVIRFRWSEGLLVPPHIHPVDEHVTIIRGVSHWGMGKARDDATTWKMTEGMSSTLPKLMPHYAIVDPPGGEIQIQGWGPFETYWVDQPCEPDPETEAPANSPRKGAAAKPK